MLEGANVLVVDDHAGNRKIIRSYLQKTGMNAYEVKDAGNAVTTILSSAGSSNEVQVAIIDCQMPGMSGIDLAHALRSIPVAQHIKLMFLTSAAQRGDVRMAREAQQAMKPRILLVEDNRINRKVVQNMLRTHDLTCDMAVDGVEAIRAVADKEYDISFMDCQMPNMDG